MTVTTDNKNEKYISELEFLEKQIANQAVRFFIITALPVVSLLLKPFIRDSGLYSIADRLITTVPFFMLMSFKLTLKDNIPNIMGFFANNPQIHKEISEEDKRNRGILLLIAVLSLYALFKMGLQKGFGAYSIFISLAILLVMQLFIHTRNKALFKKLKNYVLDTDSDF